MSSRTWQGLRPETPALGNHRQCGGGAAPGTPRGKGAQELNGAPAPDSRGKLSCKGRGTLGPLREAELGCWHLPGTPEHSWGVSLGP